MLGEALNAKDLMPAQIGKKVIVATKNNLLQDHHHPMSLCCGMRESSEFSQCEPEGSV